MASAEISPSELRFRFQLGKLLAASITIHNPSSQKMGFKVKTTTPKKYVVRPSSGILEPNTTTAVQVMMQAQKEYPPDMSNCKDKFLVQTVLLLPGQDLEADTFRGDTVKDTKLRVVLEGPPAPPSPVPEASENEEEARSDVMAGSAAAAAAAAGGERGAPAYRTALDNLAAVTADNNSLKAQVSALQRERDAWKSKAEAAAFHSAAGGGAGTTGSKKVAVLPSRLAILHMILVAIIAFLVGHYT